MASDGKWFDIFDETQLRYEQIPFEEQCLELLDEHTHMWEMVRRGVLHCWSCGAERFLSKRSAVQSTARRKPNER